MKRLFDMMGGLLGKKTHTQYMQQAAQALTADNLAQAEKDYARALEMASELKAHDDIAEISKQLGRIAERTDKLAVAETHYRRAYQTHEDSEQHEATAECLILLGQLYYKQRRLPDAEQVLQYAMSVYQSQFGTNAEGIARAACCLADCYLSRNLYVEAEKLLKRAVQIADARNENDLPSTAVAQYKLGICAAGQKKDDEADAAFKKACAALSKHENEFDSKLAHQACACYHQFGKFYLEHGKGAAARPWFDKATKLAQTYPGYLDEADLAERAAASTK
jgi:tetratricopeptide (TPR) repeat protein